MEYGPPKRRDRTYGSPVTRQVHRSSSRSRSNRPRPVSRSRSRDDYRGRVRSLSVSVSRRITPRRQSRSRTPKPRYGRPSPSQRQSPARPRSPRRSPSRRQSPIPRRRSPSRRRPAPKPSRSRRRRSPCFRVRRRSNRGASTPAVSSVASGKTHLFTLTIAEEESKCEEYKTKMLAMLMELGIPDAYDVAIEKIDGIRVRPPRSRETNQTTYAASTKADLVAEHLHSTPIPQPPQLDTLPNLSKLTKLPPRPTQVTEDEIKVKQILRGETAHVIPTTMTPIDSIPPVQMIRPSGEQPLPFQNIMTKMTPLGARKEEDATDVKPKLGSHGLPIRPPASVTPVAGIVPAPVIKNCIVPAPPITPSPLLMNSLQKLPNLLEACDPKNASMHTMEHTHNTRIRPTAPPIIRAPIGAPIGAPKAVSSSISPEARRNAPDDDDYASYDECEVEGEGEGGGEWQGGGEADDNASNDYLSDKEEVHA